MEKTLSKKATKILDKMVDGLGEFEARTIDNAKHFMAAHIERIGANQVSVAHYFVQEGDMCQDPEMVFLKTPAGWVQMFFQQALPPVFDVACKLDNAGEIVEVHPRNMKSLVAFANQWMQNIAEQQEIKV